MRRTRGAVICMRCYGSSKGRAEIANVALSVVTPRLSDNLSNFTQKLQHSKKKNRRFNLFVSLATCCIVSNVQSDIKSLHCELQNLPRASLTQSIDVLPSKRKNVQYYVTSLVDFLTVHHNPHILDKAIDNLERLRCGYPSLILCESVQSLEYRFDVLLSKKLLNKFFCVALS